MPKQKAVGALTAALLLSACASTYRLSHRAEAERAAMTRGQAEAVLKAYLLPTAAGGGLCLLGEHLPTRLDAREAPKMQGTRIGFSAEFAGLANVAVLGDVAQGQGNVTLTYVPRPGTGSVNAGNLKDIRVLVADPGAVATRCPAVKAGYMVVLQTRTGLPDMAEISFNVASHKGVDRLLAALTYLSPHAPVVQGLGML